MAVLDPRRARHIQVGDPLPRLHAAQEGEAPVQGSDLGLAGDDGEPADGADDVSVVVELVAADVAPHHLGALARADHHRAARRAGRHRHTTAEQPAEAPDQLVTRRLERALHELLGRSRLHAQAGRLPVDVVAVDVVHDHAGDRAVLPRVVDLLVAQPQVRAVLGRRRRRADQQDGEHE
jgi:hypothetical protein